MKIQVQVGKKWYDLFQYRAGGLIVKRGEDFFAFTLSDVERVRVNRAG